MKKYDYRDKMDPEVINLCDAINEIPGFYTTGSCCGHGKEPFQIDFYVADGYTNWLLIIARCTFETHNHYENHRFRCIVRHTDLHTRPVIYVLESMDKGKEAYQEADKVATSIRKYLEFDNFIEAFNLGK